MNGTTRGKLNLYGRLAAMQTMVIPANLVQAGDIQMDRYQTPCLVESVRYGCAASVVLDLLTEKGNRFSFNLWTDPATGEMQSVRVWREISTATPETTLAALARPECDEFDSAAIGERFDAMMGGMV